MKDNFQLQLGLKHDAIRVFVPGASQVEIEMKGQKVALTPLQEGLFEIKTPERLSSRDYRVQYKSGGWFHDPYAFAPTLTDGDFALFLQGKDDRLYDKLGAHLMEMDGVAGVRFAVWAPHADRVCLSCDLNHFSETLWPMHYLQESGVWEIFIPGAFEGMVYKFAIHSGGHVQMRADPFAFRSEMRPRTASIVAKIEEYPWSDHEWMRGRASNDCHNRPMNIYEVHLGSWRRKEGAFMNYREIAHQLADYCKEMHFTHIEILPVTEHPLDESWGYQVIGYFSATSRFGSPADFQYFINHMHQNGISIILDWVGGHFPTDAFALAQYDGSYLYEYEDPKQGYHPHWNTLIFDYTKPQVTNFLKASTLFWADKMHLDGFRFDAVSSIVYASFGREEGEWVPNKHGGSENLEAIAFLKDLNSRLHELYPGIFTIAEESSTFPKVSFPANEGGLGFDFKSNLGWMNDTLKFFTTDFPYRSHRFNHLTFYMHYAYDERFALFLSHDEVVHEKRSLIGKMPGDQKQQFAGTRLLYTMMMTLPGKKLIFMGAEIGQWNEWNESEEIHWYLLAYPTHQALQRCVRSINHYYVSTGALWEMDHVREGFQWISCDDRNSLVMAYLRRGGGKTLLVIHNFSQNHYPDYTLAVDNMMGAHEVFNSDLNDYGGDGITNPTLFVEQARVRLSLAPLVTSICEVEFG